ncbi:MAG: CHASE2 domain-containing protein [Rhodoferax sp.]|nr:CHASE2 domain-containing protein [Rhodoferax sp.]
MNHAAGRHLQEWRLLSLLLLVFLLLAQRGQWFERLDNGLYDTRVSWDGRPAPSDILILAIDETSLARVGRWPWSRQVLAQVIERLTQAGAGPVLVDVILAEPQQDDPAADAHLAQAIAAHGRVVLPVFMPGAGVATVRPLAQFAAVARLGHAQALVDKDGVTRRYLAWEQGDGVTYPHLALALREAARAAHGAAAATADAGTTGATERLVPFAGPAGHFARIPVVDLLDGRVDPARLRGATILIGATATGLGDTVVTPLAGVNGAMPGVEFVAHVLDAERQGVLRQTVSVPVQMGVGAGVVVLYLVALLLLSPRRALVLTVVLAAGLPVLAWTVMTQAGWWCPIAAVVLTVLLAYPLWSWRRLEASLVTMTRETARMATLLHPSALALNDTKGPHFLDPVESRIAAITQAVDEVADALAVDGDADQAQQYRDDMMRHLAHDLRSPLVSLRALADQLRVGSPAEHAAMIARVDACARRSLELTEQFLLIGRAQSVEPHQFAEVDLVSLLHNCADDLWEDAEALGGRIERRCDADLALVVGDERLLRRAVLNMGWNALRHGPPGGTVTLSLHPAHGHWVLSVHDQGRGFAAQEFAVLSRRYASGKAGSSGHGLGLALVQLVAQKHQAVVEIDHPSTGGFTMGLRFVYIS